MNIRKLYDKLNDHAELINPNNDDEAYRPSALN